jgi:hypothetical protein
VATDKTTGACDNNTSIVLQFALLLVHHTAFVFIRINPKSPDTVST